jgi:hypothetical protein
MTTTAPTPTELQVKGSDAEPFACLVSTWADLLHVQMVIFHLEQLPPKPNTGFVARALWEDAVVTYGRCFNTGRRSSVVDKLEPLVAALPQSLRTTHDEILHWRNKHVAHRVDERYEQTQVVVGVNGDPSTSTPLYARAYVTVKLSADITTIAALGKLATYLKDTIWERHFKDCEAKLVASFDPSRAQIAQIKKAERGEREMTLTVNP